MSTFQLLPDNLTLWRLKESHHTTWWVMTEPKTGQPLVHRNPICSGAHVAEADLRHREQDGFDVVESLWESERIKRFMGKPSVVGFCEHCVCEPV